MARANRDQRQQNVNYSCYNLIIEDMTIILKCFCGRVFCSWNPWSKAEKTTWLESRANPPTLAANSWTHGREPITSVSCIYCHRWCVLNAVIQQKEGINVGPFSVSSSKREKKSERGSLERLNELTEGQALLELIDDLSLAVIRQTSGPNASLPGIRFR